MFTVKRQPVTWTIEIEPREGETWPAMTAAFGANRWRFRPYRLALTVHEDELDNPSNYLDVREGRRIRQDGSEGARVGHFHSVFAGDLPVEILQSVKVALDTVRGEARNLGLIKEED